MDGKGKSGATGYTAERPLGTGQKEELSDTPGDDSPSTDEKEKIRGSG